MVTTPTISERIANDPQMSLPRRPRLPEDLALVWHSRRALMAFGGPSPVVLRGGSVQAVLPRLLPLLDGRHDVEKLAQALPQVSHGVLTDTLAMLFTQGLLEEGDRPVGSGGPSREQAARFQLTALFLSRHLDITRAGSNRWDSLLRMQASAVCLLAGSPHAGAVVRTLKELGLGRLTLVTTDAALVAAVRLLSDACFSVDVVDAEPSALDDERLRELLAAHAATALVAGEDSEPLLLRINTLASRQPTSLFYAVLDAAKIQIGPAVDGDQSACYHCASASGVLAGQPRQTSRYDEGALEMAAERCALGLWSLLTKFVPIEVVDTVTEPDDTGLGLHSTRVYHQFGCPVCSHRHEAPWQPAAQLPTGRGGTAPLSWFYHQHSNHQAHQIVPKGHFGHYAPANEQAAIGAYKTVRSRGTRLLALPERLPPAFAAPFAGGAVEAAAPPAACAPQLERVGQLVALVAARFGDGPDSPGRRLTPSAGNLGSQTLYLLNIGLAGLPRGVYHYNPLGTLDTVAQEPALYAAWIENLLPAGTRLPARTGAVLVLSSAHARLQGKYGQTAYRYGLYDSGAMYASLQFVAPRLGLEVQHCGDFADDDVARLIGCGYLSEHPTLICCVIDRAPAELAS